MTRIDYAVSQFYLKLSILSSWDFLPRKILSCGEISSVMATRRKKSSRRTVIEPRKGDRRYVRRNKRGQFKQEVNVGRSLAADRRRKAKTKAKPGQGDRGDVVRSSGKRSRRWAGK